MREAALAREAEAPAEIVTEDARSHRQQAAGIQTIKFDGADAPGLPREGLPGRLGRHHQAEPGTRPEAQGILLEEIATAFVPK